MVRIVLYIYMRREQHLPQPSQNQHFQEMSNLLILHDIKSPGINTSKKSRNSRIPIIPIDFNSSRINTSGAKDLKSSRINTSGNKDLKSRRINTSKKHRRGVGIAAFPLSNNTRRQPSATPNSLFVASRAAFVTRSGFSAPQARPGEPRDAAAIDTHTAAPYPEFEACITPRPMDIF
jgi:hypothetical protein